MNFSLLQVSDLHLVAKYEYVDYAALVEHLARKFFLPADPEIALQLEDAVKRLINRVDAVLVTGDLADSGDLRHLREAGAFCERLRPGNLVVFPGNHDRFRRKRGVPRPGGTLFDQVFSGYWDVGQSVKSFLIEKEGVRLAIVAADFTLRSDGGGAGLISWGQGEAYSDVVDSLRGETHKWRKQQVAVMWALHFPPGGEEFVRSSLKLVNWPSVVDAAASEGVRFCLAGHVHEFKVIRLGAARKFSVCCVSSGCCRPPVWKQKAENGIYGVRVAVEDCQINSISLLPILWTERGFEPKYGRVERLD